MLKISSIRINGLEQGCVTDERPNISFVLESGVQGESLAKAVITVGGWTAETTDQINNIYGGEMKPYTRYIVRIAAIGASGEKADAEAFFETGRLGTPWGAQWITDGGYQFPEKVSPAPMTFRTRFGINKPVSRAWINATALGIYELSINGQKAGEDYFAPGLTSYDHQIQYQTYNVTKLLKNSNTILAVVVGGWAAGSFTYKRVNKIYADRQAFLCELHLEYEDGTRDVVCTDETWQVTEDGNYRMAEWYDGETYDATVDLDTVSWKQATSTRLGKSPKLLAQYGDPVRAQELIKPASVSEAPSGEFIYDFGQNFAGVISAKLKGQKGQSVVFRHAEVLVDGELFVKSLRTAKATATYICIDGEQTYTPRLTYMGFRYVGLRGISPEDIELSAIVLHSDFEEISAFQCSNETLNKLVSNIRWSGKSNFVDIPTDCPQRDERQGWTGDISVFARTACYHFNLERFLDKWLLDMLAEQGAGGGIPMVIPRAGDNWPVMATSCWGDSCVLVPWAEYLARGNKRILERQYPVMKKFLKAAKWWSGLLSLTPNRRYIWRFPFHFGDWCAPEGSAQQWVARGKWIGTAYFANSCGIIAQTAELLGYTEDAAYYTKQRQKIIKSYRRVLTDGNGRLKKEFQTAYVLPLHFEMTAGQETTEMAANLVRLVREADTHLATGFTGTPYLLFALSDNGYTDVAYDLLLQDTCPSWLYEVKAGGTTIWERWDALRPDGTVNIAELTSKKADEESTGGMVSFNHYAYGAVADWLYRRMCGLEADAREPGYKYFTVKPIPDRRFSYAETSHRSPYGEIRVRWDLVSDSFTLAVTVPCGTTADIKLPDGQTFNVKSGTHSFSCVLP